MVFGAIQRGGKVVTKIVENTTVSSLTAAVRENVQEGATMVSDENTGYNAVSKFYTHLTVNHSKDQYVNGIAHTNTLEGFWSLLKKQINGIHHSVSSKHLQRYCNEASYRYNRKGKGQDERFSDAVSNCERRLKYSDLIKK